MSRLLLGLAAIGASVMLTIALAEIHKATGGWPPPFMAGAIVGATATLVIQLGSGRR